MNIKKKIFIGLIAIIVFVCIICAGASSASSLSDDPADSYVVQTAPNEDGSIKLWFDYSFRKTFTSDTTPTGMNTFSIYMAKNEIEDAQFVLYSDTDKTGMNATISQFTDSNGNTVEAEIYYEMYVTTSNLNTVDAVWGATEETTFIREGETPDPIVPLSKLSSFKLNGGKSQAFLIRAKTTLESKSGWYSAQLDIKNSAGQIVKTATVYLYVWNIDLSEKTVFQTAFYTANDSTYGGTYQQFYDYLLENRLNAMDLPGGTPSSTNSYINNDRVTAIRVSNGGGGAAESPKYMDKIADYINYNSIYEELTTMENWDEVKDKFYFYTTDEPACTEQLDAVRQWNQTARIDTWAQTVSYAAYIDTTWRDAQKVVPMHTNSPYLEYYYRSPLESYNDYELYDGIQGCIDTNSVTIWCPQLYYFTPYSVAKGAGFAGVNNTNGIYNSDGPISGMYSFSNPSAQDGISYVGCYYDWNGLYGNFEDRVKSAISVSNANGGNSKLWTYRAGSNFLYTYAHHLIEDPGLQTKMLIWQCFQLDITGYLYYYTNEWGSYIDGTDTGAKTTSLWRTNKYHYNDAYGYDIYGMGVLFYGKVQAKVNVPVVGSLRVELLRDGVEEYQMMDMIRELKGEDVAKSYVNSISNNVTDYISMPLYNRSSWDSSMDEYDIMEYVRRSLGNDLEAAIAETQCNHKYGEGVITIEAGCKTIGELTYTCTLCGATQKEDIPSTHSDFSTMVKISGSPATCTEESTEIYQCTVCGYCRKPNVNTKAIHNNRDLWSYKLSTKNEKCHIIYCYMCNKELNDIETHKLVINQKAATCQEAGYRKNECVYCHYVSEETTYDIIDHNYVNGHCTMCGLSDGTVPEEPEEPEVMYGDTNGDGKINALDANYLAQIIVGNAASVEAADISKDGKVNATDSNLLKQIIAGTYTIS